ncbi:hypothetical protein OG536_25560 [Streptomyces anulatus]|nr:hypothetical protein OG536_25560 [Streptomyces anulatus]
MLRAKEAEEAKKGGIRAGDDEKDVRTPLSGNEKEKAAPADGIRPGAAVMGPAGAEKGSRGKKKKKRGRRALGQASATENVGYAVPGHAEKRQLKGGDLGRCGAARHAEKYERPP